jgi:prepilin-type N-terminal cleavage/methylation domain-containing protein
MKKAMTLIEVLIVFAILGVIAARLVSALVSRQKVMEEEIRVALAAYPPLPNDDSPQVSYVLEPKLKMCFVIVRFWANTSVTTYLQAGTATPINCERIKDKVTATAVVK